MVQSRFAQVCQRLHVNENVRMRPRGAIRRQEMVMSTEVRRAKLLTVQIGAEMKFPHESIPTCLEGNYSKGSLREHFEQNRGPRRRLTYISLVSCLIHAIIFIDTPNTHMVARILERTRTLTASGSHPEG